MLKLLKNIIIRIITNFSRNLSKTRVGNIFCEAMINDSMRRVECVNYHNLEMYFTVPNQLNKYRINTFSTKEPETLDWIDSLPESCVLWDIGANIGLYSIYAAIKRNCKVFSFEPSVFNLELLARNVFLNDLQNRITILPFALSDKMNISKIHITSTEWGGACSTFGKNFGWDGKPIQEVFSFKTFGTSMDQAVSILNIPLPDFIKMDVDGIEHYILMGGEIVLKSIKGVLIEINDDFSDQAFQVYNILHKSGFSLFDKKHGEWSDNTPYKYCYNQIWVRS
tara:strand:- start:37 stop:879 length:843 start_codon:yes stop_codon:yes gene_type:complete